MFSSIRSIALFSIALLPLAAQTYTAQISGVATDASASVVVGAGVSMTNLDTGVVQHTATNQTGIYRLLELPPGRYRLEVSMAGFKKYVQEPLALQVADRISLNVSLQLGEVTTQVTVTGEQPLIEGGNPDFAQLVTRDMMEELPLESRNVLELASLTPGFVETPSFLDLNGNNAPNFNFSNFKLGGGRALGQEVLLDGTPDAAPDRGYGQFIPPVDSTQEYKVFANAFSAEFGRSSGAVVNMVTKSGTNKYHGAAYEFAQNSVFTANNFFANRIGAVKPDFGRNEFGANLGGPIVRNRTFFFADLDIWRKSQPTFTLSTVPTALQRAGDFSQTFTLGAADPQLIKIYDPQTVVQSGQNYTRAPFPNNVIPSSRFDPAAVAALGFYPAPNLPGDPVTGANNYFANAPADDNRNTWEIKLDQYLGSKHRLTGRVSQTTFDLTTSAAWPGPSARGAHSDRGAFTNIMLSDVATLAPSAVLEVRASFSRSHDRYHPNSTGFDLKSLKLPDYYVQAAQPYFPDITNSDESALGGWQEVLDYARNTYALAVSLSKQSGQHSIKVGADIRRLQFNPYDNPTPAGLFAFNRNFTQGPNPLAASKTAGYSVASFLLGAGASGSLAYPFRPAYARQYYAGYVQDDWKLSPNVTLNLGLRYDVEVGPTERHNRMGYIDLSAPSPLASLPGLGQLMGEPAFLNSGDRNLLFTDTNNFGPRAGLTTRLGQKTVARLGYGVFYVPMSMVPTLGAIGFSTSTSWTTTRDNGITIADPLHDPYPLGFNQLTNNPGPTANLGQALDATLRNEPVGYTQQWSVSVQREVAHGLAAEAVYWGNKGTDLQVAAGIQQDYLPDQYLALGSALSKMLPNPFYGAVKVGILANPTVSQRQLLLTYPQYTSVNRIVPMAASSIYHAVTFRLERRFGSLNLQGSYTISKSIDDSSGQETQGDSSGGPVDPQNRRLERSVSTFDVPQRLVANGYWRIPVGRGARFGASMHPVLSALVGNWTLAGIATVRSGMPVFVGRPMNNGHSAKLANPTIDRWFNTSVFSPVGTYQIPTTGRLLPDVRQDGLRSFDLSAMKSFRLTERFTVQIRAEAFNVLNTPCFGAPTSGVSNVAFGVVNSQANKPRSAQLSAKLAW